MPRLCLPTDACGRSSAVSGGSAAPSSSIGYSIAQATNDPAYAAAIARASHPLPTPTAEAHCNQTTPPSSPSNNDNGSSRSSPPNPTLAVATAAAANVYKLNSEWTMPRNKAYETHLRKLMTFVHQHKRDYPAGTTFTRDQLLQL